MGNGEGVHTREVDVARLQELSELRGTRVVVEGESYVLWRAGERVVAASNHCPHQHFDTLHLGPVEAGSVTCPMHGWSFSLETGTAVAGSGRLRLVPVHIRGGRVYIELHDRS